MKKIFYGTIFLSAAILLFGGAFSVQAADYIKITNTALWGSASQSTVLNFPYTVSGPTPFQKNISISYDPVFVPTVATTPMAVTAGTYSISLTSPIPAGWRLTSITCYYGDSNVYNGQDPLATPSSIDLSTGKIVGIQANGGREVTCNFYYAFIGNPTPYILSISPTKKNVIDPAFTLTINGENFTSSSIIYFGSLAVPTTYVSATKLTTQIASGGAPGNYAVTVVSPAPGGGTSSPINFLLEASPATWPTVESVWPSSIPTSSTDTTITVTGTNFVQGSAVKIFNGQAIATTYVTSKKLTAVIPASFLTQQMSTLVTVANPNGGGTSATNNNAALRIYSAQYPPPIITGHVPNPIPLSANALSYQTIILNGSNFQDGAALYVYVNGVLQSSNYNVHYLSPTQITFTMHPPTASDPMFTYEVAVINPTDPDPSHQRLTTSDRFKLAFDIAPTQQQNPVPTITSITPTSAIPGGSQFNVKITGTNFTLTSQAYFGANPTTTYYISPTELQAPFFFSPSYQPGSYNITVVNPAPGGGTSNGKVFTVGSLAPITPTIISITPSTVTAGSQGVALAIQGTNFTAGSVVTINGVLRATTFQSATTLTVNVASADIATAGTKLIKVADPSNGTSNGVVLTIANPSAQYGTLKVTKNTTGGDGTFSFSGTAGSFQISTLSGTGTKTIDNIPPGTYTITESTQAGWTQASTTCSNITVSVGQQTTCAFNNAKIQDNGGGGSTTNNPGGNGGINPAWIAVGILPLLIFAVVGLALLPK